MKAEQIIEVIDKLVGGFEPIGESNYDAKAKKNLEKEYPFIQIVGTHDGYFDEEDNPKPSPKPKAQPKVDVSLGETFNPTGSSSAVSATFNKLMIANRALWKEICPTFMALKQKAAELGIDVNSITTQEQFEGMLT